MPESIFFTPHSGISYFASLELNAGRHLFHTPLGHFMNFHPWALMPESIFFIPLSKFHFSYRWGWMPERIFSYPSRSFHEFLSLEISAGRHLFHAPLKHFIIFIPRMKCRKASFSYPSRAFHDFLSPDLIAGRHPFSYHPRH